MFGKELEWALCGAYIQYVFQVVCSYNLKIENKVKEGCKLVILYGGSMLNYTTLVSKPYCTLRITINVCVTLFVDLNNKYNMWFTEIGEYIVHMITFIYHFLNTFYDKI